MCKGVHLLPASLPPRLTPARLSLLADAGWADDIVAERDGIDDSSWAVKVAGADGHQATYYFHDDERTITLGLITLFPDGGETKMERGKGWGRWKFARLIDGWAQAGYTTCRIDEAVGNWRSKRWTGYYVWPRFGFDGLMTPAQHARLPQTHRGSRRLQELFAKPGGAAVWKRFGGKLKDLTFDLTPGSESWRLLERPVS